MFPDNETDYTCELQPLSIDIIQDRDTYTNIDSLVLEAVLYKLAGKLGPIFDYHFTPKASMHIAQAIKQRLNQDDGHIYNLACIELAEQLLRNNDIQIGLQELFPIINGFIYVPGREFSNNLPSYSGRALIAYGKLLIENKAYRAAEAAFSAVLTPQVCAEVPKSQIDKQKNMALVLKEEAANRRKQISPRLLSPR